MGDVGSDDWITAFADRAADVVVDDAVGSSCSRSWTDTGAAWHVVVAGGRAVVTGGRHPPPDVTITEDRPTATAIAAGELSASRRSSTAGSGCGAASTDCRRPPACSPSWGL